MLLLGALERMVVSWCPVGSELLLGTYFYGKSYSQHFTDISSSLQPQCSVAITLFISQMGSWGSVQLSNNEAL